MCFKNELEEQLGGISNLIGRVCILSDSVEVTLFWNDKLHRLEIRDQEKVVYFLVGSIKEAMEDGGFLIELLKPRELSVVSNSTRIISKKLFEQTYKKAS